MQRICLYSVLAALIFTSTQSAATEPFNFDHLINDLSEQEAFFVAILQQPDYASGQEIATHIERLLQATTLLQKNYPAQCNALYQALAQSIGAVTSKDQKLLAELIAYHGIKNSIDWMRFPFMTTIAKHTAQLLKKSSEPALHEIIRAVDSIHQSCSEITQKLISLIETSDQETTAESTSFLRTYGPWLVIGGMIAAGIIILVYNMIKPLLTKITDLEHRQNTLNKQFQDVARAVTTLDQTERARHTSIIRQVNERLEPVIAHVNQELQRITGDLTDQAEEIIRREIQRFNEANRAYYEALVVPRAEPQQPPPRPGDRPLWQHLFGST